MVRLLAIAERLSSWLIGNLRENGFSELVEMRGGLYLATNFLKQALAIKTYLCLLFSHQAMVLQTLLCMIRMWLHISYFFLVALREPLQ